MPDNKQETDAMERLDVRDWIEDFVDDNGRYSHTCSTCGNHFLGHKRRVSECKKCWIAFAEKIVIAHNAAALPRAVDEAIAQAESVEFIYAPEVRIKVYPRTNKVTVHYRERDGDWLNDSTVDTDFYGDRKWAGFNSLDEAFEFLKGLYRRTGDAG
jgi:hypothetical protein